MNLEKTDGKNSKIDPEVKKKLSELEEKLDKKDKRIRKLEQKIASKSQAESKEKKGFSRREFLKKAGLGTAGLAALMSPVSAFDIRSDDFNVYTRDSGSIRTFEVDGDGNVAINEGNLEIQGEIAATETWASNNFNHYSDSDARDAVDNSSLNSLTLARDGLNSSDEWLEINGGESGILLGYSGTGEIRNYEDTDFQGNDIHNVGTVDGVDISNHASDSSAHHTRYTDSEASDAAPVQTVNGETGNVEAGELQTTSHSWGTTSTSTSTNEFTRRIWQTASKIYLYVEGSSNYDGSEVVVATTENTYSLSIGSVDDSDEETYELESNELVRYVYIWYDQWCASYADIDFEHPI